MGQWPGDPHPGSPEEAFGGRWSPSPSPAGSGGRGRKSLYITESGAVFRQEKKGITLVEIDHGWTFSGTS